MMGQSTRTELPCVRILIEAQTLPLCHVLKLHSVHAVLIMCVLVCTVYMYMQ